MRIIFTIIIFFFAYTATSQNLAWAKQFKTQPVTTTYAHHGIAIATDVPGNVYSVGYIETPCDLDPGPGTFILQDYYFSKLDVNGNFVWAKTFGYRVIISKIALDALGNIYLTGIFFDGTTDFDPGPGVHTLTVSNFASGMGFICKFDQNGNFLWVKELGTDAPNNYVMPAYITLDDVGNIYTTGVYSEDADMDPGPGVSMITTLPLEWNCFISKLDANGNYVWARNFNGVSNRGTAMTIDADGNVYTVGDFSESIDLDPGPALYTLTTFPGQPADEMFISKLDINGNFIWGKQCRSLNTSSSAGTATIALDPFSSLVIIGYFSGEVDFNPGPAVNMMASIPGGYSSFILKLDDAGNYTWSKQIDGTVGTEGTVDNVGNIYLYCLSTTASVDMDPGTGIAIITSPNVNTTIAAKYDNNAGLLWTYYAELGWGPYDLATDATGNLYLTGGFTGTVDFDPGPGTTILTCDTEQDPFVLKINGCSVATTSSLNAAACNSYTLNNQTFIITGAYTQTLVNSTGCDSIITLNLIINTAAMVDLYDTAYNSYTWEGQTYTTSGDYLITLTAANGCDSIRTLHLFIKPGVNCSLIIPNAITPNGDGINDTWIISKPLAYCFKQIDVYVYNRYGSLIYKKIDYKDDWKGNYRSKPVPDATYYYVIQAMSVDGNKQTFKGNLTILR